MPYANYVISLLTLSTRLNLSIIECFKDTDLYIVYNLLAVRFVPHNAGVFLFFVCLGLSIEGFIDGGGLTYHQGYCLS